MNNIDIVSINTFPHLNTYSVKYEDSSLSEFEKFYNTYIETKPEELNIILNLINNIGTKTGLHKRFFRFENNIYALPNKKSETKLRLYCSIYGSKILVLFNGGFKTKNTTQEDSNVSPKYYDGESFHKKIMVCLDSRSLRIENGLFVGELNFYL